MYSPVALPRETLAACGAPQTLDRVYPEQPRVTSPSPTGGPHAAPRNIQHVVKDEWPGKRATLRKSQVYLQHVNSYTSWDPRPLEGSYKRVNAEPLEGSSPRSTLSRQIITRTIIKHHSQKEDWAYPVHIEQAIAATLRADCWGGCRDVTCVWGALGSYASCVLRLC